MSTEFWVGVAVIPALAVMLLLLWLLFSLASYAWDKLHRKMILKVDLKGNPITFRFRGDTSPKPAPRPKYEDAANHLRDALLRSPSVCLVKGLGWNLVIVRDTKNAPEMES